MNYKRIRDTPKEIRVPEGYRVDELIDTDGEGYGFDEEVRSEEVLILYGRREERAVH